MSHLSYLSLLQVIPELLYLIYFRKYLNLKYNQNLVTNFNSREKEMFGDWEFRQGKGEECDSRQVQKKAYGDCSGGMWSKEASESCVWLVWDCQSGGFETSVDWNWKLTRLCAAKQSRGDQRDDLCIVHGRGSDEDCARKIPWKWYLSHDFSFLLFLPCQYYF